MRGNIMEDIRLFKCWKCSRTVEDIDDTGYTICPQCLEEEEN